MNEMKMSGPLIQNDASLEWDDFIPVASNIPQDVFYQATTANSANVGGFSFYVLSPATNALLSNEAIIEYSILIDSTNVLTLVTNFERTGANANAADGNGGINSGTSFENFLRSTNNYRLALRQCWPICRAMQNISLNINGTVISGQPEIWMDALNRLYISEEEAATICTLSGGEFDSGNRGPFVDSDNTIVLTSGAGAVNNNTLNGFCYQGYYSAAAAAATTMQGFTSWPNDEQYYNKGFSKRFHRFALLNRAGGSLTGSSAYGSGTANAFTNLTAVSAKPLGSDRFVNQSAGAFANGVVFINIFERVPICPFLMYESRDAKVSIPNVRVLNLNVQMDSNAAPLILQGASFTVAQASGLASYTALGVNPLIDFYSNKPILHLKWYMTSMPIPESVSIPAWVVRENIYQLTSSVTANNFPITAPVSGSMVNTYSSVNFEGIPDLLLVFIKKNPSQAAYIDPSDHNMEITSLNLTVAGVAGKVLQMSSGELYKTWLENIYHKGENKSDYQTWRKKNCVLALRPKDYGALFGPGFNYPIQMNFLITSYSWWNIPAIQNTASLAIDAGQAVTYNLYVVAFYQRYVLELNASGGSRLDLLKVPIHQLKIGQAPNSLLERAPQ